MRHGLTVRALQQFVVPNNATKAESGVNGFTFLLPCAPNSIGGIENKLISTKPKGVERYLWNICGGVVPLAIIVFVFSRLHGRTETIVVSILGLVFVLLRGLQLQQSF